MRAIDADSLVRLIRIRSKWHDGLTVEEVVEMIKEAPTLEDKDRMPTMKAFPILTRIVYYLLMQRIKERKTWKNT